MTGRGAVWRGLAIVAVLSIWEAPSAAAAPDRPWLVGVNLAGAEFGSKAFPGKINEDYVYPTGEDIDYFLDRGMNAIRLPFRWERLQLNLGWDMEGAELERLDEVVSYITGRGAYVILDPHNYGAYFGRKIGTKDVPVSAYAWFWGELAARYRDNEWVVFGLMNEPHGIDSDDWRTAVDAAIAAIRDTGARNLILVPGTAWSGAHSWSKARDGRPNADAFASLSDPADNMAFEVHQYFDSDHSGTHMKCENETIGTETLEDFTRWLRETGHRGFLGEFAVTDSEVCLTVLDSVLKHLSDNDDVWIGWTYWAAGAWWNDYPFSVHPSSEGDRPQMRTLMKYTAPHMLEESPDDSPPDEDRPADGEEGLEGDAGRS